MKLYLDLDDTVFNTTEYLEEILSWDKNQTGSVYDRFVVSGDFVSMSGMLNYYEIPLKIKKSEIDLLKEKHKVVICSEYCTEGEFLLKKKVCKDILGVDDIIGVYRLESRKYTLDLSDGILIDDNIEILHKCNAFKKFWYADDIVLSNIRSDIVLNPEEMRDIVSVRDFKGLYAELERLGV